MTDFRPTNMMLPPVVKNLLIINGLFFLAYIVLQYSHNIDLNQIFGLHFWRAEKFEPYQFITYMFMHASFMHIFFNMFALWMFGRMLENYWGPKRFLIYFLITGIGASLIHYGVFYFEIKPTLQAVNDYLANPGLEKFIGFIESSRFELGTGEMYNNYLSFRQEYNAVVVDDPSKALSLSVDYMTQYKVDFLNAPVVVGASGAVFGILLAFGMLFPNSVIYLYFAIPIKAKYFVMIYGALELFAGLSNQAGDNVAHFAHLGGMIFGFFLIKYWKKR